MAHPASTITTRVSESGKVSLPSAHRRELGLEPGDRVVLRVVDGELRIRSLRAQLREAQREARELLGDYSVDQFLAEKYADAAIEAEEY